VRAVKLVADDIELALFEFGHADAAPAFGGPDQGGIHQLQDGTLAEGTRDDLGAPSFLAKQPLEQVGNWYEDRGACSSGWGVQSWCMVRPSGTRGAGSTSVGRPIRIMSRELALVAGRPCDRPGCAESADP
jgi:hypothetical protein